MPPLLTLQDIHLTFGGAPLFQGAELALGERERVCLVGRNGSGKSTLLKIAAGLAEADRGVCAMERKMFEKVLGRSLRLSQCRLDGHRSCDFEAKPVVISGPAKAV